MNSGFGILMILSGVPVYWVAISWKVRAYLTKGLWALIVFVCDGIKNSAQTIIQPPMVSLSSLSLSLSVPVHFKKWITF